MSGFDNDVLVAKNVNFDQASPFAHVGILNSAGKLPIGTGSTYPTPEILGGSIVSPMGTLTVGYSSPNITLDLTGSGVGIDSIAVQTGTSPVSATGAGLITLNGGTVAAGTNPLRTNGTDANTLAIQAQLSQAISSTDATKVGLCNFDTVSFSVDVNGFVTLSPKIGLGVANLGLTLSAGVFSVTAANGSALSATNPAYVVLSSRANPGRLVRYTVTANQSFNDASSGSSTIVGNLFGLTTSIAYTQELPFFVYAVGDDTEQSISFMISRYPSATDSAPAAKMGKTGSAVASTQGSFFALGNPTVTNYDTNPCLCIGAFRMKMNSSNDWTVEPLINGLGNGSSFYRGADGIGQFHDESKFVMALAQFGASASTYFKPNGGTAPVFNALTQEASFYIRKNGQVNFFIITGECTTAGVGAVSAQVALPYICSNTSANSSGTFVSGTPTAFGLIGSITNATNNFTFVKFNTSTFAAVLNSDIVLGASASFITGASYQAIYS